MSTPWRVRGPVGERNGAPVELRFVDMFMAAIGALIFMAMLMSYMVSLQSTRRSARLSIYASLVPDDGNPATSNALSHLFDLSLTLKEPYTETNAFFDKRHPIAADSAEQTKLLLCNNTQGWQANLPGLLLVWDEPPDTGTNRESYALSVGVSSRPHRTDQEQGLASLKGRLEVTVRFAGGSTPNPTNLCLDRRIVTLSDLLAQAAQADSNGTNFLISTNFQVPAYKDSTNAKSGNPTRMASRAE